MSTEDEEREDEETATEEYDDSAVAAFRAKKEALESRLAVAAEAAQGQRRKSWVFGATVGLVCGIGIGWSLGGSAASSKAVRSPDAAPASQTAIDMVEPGTNSETSAAVEPAVATADAAPPVATAAPTATLPDAAPTAAPPDAAPTATPPDAAPTPPSPAVAPTPPATAPPPADTPASGIPIPSPRDGTVSKIFAKPGQRVWKGERLYEVTRQTTPEEEAAKYAAEVARLEAISPRSEEQEAELAEAIRKRDLFQAGFKGDRKSVAYAPEGGYFEHQLKVGASVMESATTGTLRPLEK